MWSNIFIIEIFSSDEIHIEMNDMEKKHAFYT